MLVLVLRHQGKRSLTTQTLPCTVPGAESRLRRPTHAHVGRAVSLGATTITLPRRICLGEVGASEPVLDAPLPVAAVAAESHRLLDQLARSLP